MWIFQNCQTTEKEKVLFLLFGFDTHFVWIVLGRTLYFLFTIGRSAIISYLRTKTNKQTNKKARTGTNHSVSGENGKTCLPLYGAKKPQDAHFKIAFLLLIVIIHIFFVSFHFVCNDFLYQTVIFFFQTNNNNNNNQKMSMLLMKIMKMLFIYLTFLKQTIF